MKRRIILLILVITGIVSLLSFILLLRYFDPYTNPTYVAVGILAISFMTWWICFLSVIIYFFKKIYYRGDVGIYHILTSVRQSFFVALFIVGMVLGITMNIPLLVPGFALASAIIFLELFIQNW